MYRARIVFNAGVFYSAEMATENGIIQMLNRMDSVLRHAVSVQLERCDQRGASTRANGWYAVLLDDRWPIMEKRRNEEG